MEEWNDGIMVKEEDEIKLSKRMER